MKYERGSKKTMSGCSLGILIFVYDTCALHFYRVDGE